MLIEIITPFQDDVSDDGQPPPSLPPPQLPPAGGPKPGPGISKGEKGAAASTANTLNLGMAQIIVTAATPMVEDGADKSFPPVGESDSQSDKDTDTDKAKEEKKPEKPSKQAEAEASAKKPDVAPKPLAKVSPSPQTAPAPAAAKEGKPGGPRPVVSITLTEYPSCDAEDQQSFSEGTDSETVPALQEADDPFNEKTKDESSGGGGGSSGFEANFEANFDANFDDAFAGAGSGSGGGGGGGGEQSHDLDVNGGPAADEEDIEAPKQVVGGRASIPEELDSNQLARLQNLKESNA